MTTEQERNKAVVRRFNQFVLANGDDAAMAELFDPEFVNRTTMPGMDAGVEGMRHVVIEVLHRGLSDVSVEILDQVAEGDTVATRKCIRGRHTGEFLGVAATDREVEIVVFDFVRLREGKYLEHWGLNTIPLLLQALQGSAPTSA